MLGLLMVRDEAKILRRCVDSLRQCCDEILVVDTGSRDDTVELAEALGRRVVRHKWKDFGANRSMSFLEASSSEELAHLTWALAIDADMTLRCDAPRLKDFLSESRDAGFTLIQVNSGLEYRNVRLRRLSEPWQCRGAMPTEKH